MILLASAFGCSSSSDSGKVQGSVTLDGQPVEVGVIRFASVDGSGQPVEATVAAGRFELAVSPGEKRVEIRAPKVTGKRKMYDTPDSPTVDIVAELLPERYNVDSELKMTVDGSEQTQDFELKSK
jgi:hypothetical protein